MKEVTVALQDTTSEAFAPYGTFLTTGSRPATFSSEAFEYWDHLDEISSDGPLSLGILESLPGQPIATNMERHENTFETLVPLDGEIVLIVAEPTRSNTADLSNVAAFRISAGTAVTLKPGTWHFVPLVSKRRVKTMIVFRSGTPDDDLYVDELAEDREVVVRVEL